MFVTISLGEQKLTKEELKTDKKNCVKIGPWGFGEKAVYPNSFFFARQYYLCYPEIKRLYKRIAMSKGGFSGKGAFGTMPYLVAEYGEGNTGLKEKQCNFKREQDVDKALSWLEKNHPEIPTRSKAAQKKLDEARLEEEKRYLKELPADADRSVKRLQSAKEYLEKKPVIYTELTEAAKQKRICDNMKMSIRIGAILVAIACLLIAIYGIVKAFDHDPYGIYYALFGGVFLLFTWMSGALPNRWNSRKLADKAWNHAVLEAKQYAEETSHFPLPPQYAHPVVCDRMIRVIKEGRCEKTEAALRIVKEDLKKLDSSVRVSQKEHDEVATVKPLFLVCDYRDDIA